MSYPYLSDVVFAITGHHFPLPVAMFGLFVGLAMIAGATLLRARLAGLYDASLIGHGWRVKERRAGSVRLEILPHDLVPDFTVVVMVAGIVGARFFHILEHTDSFMVSPWEMIFSRSGLSVFGGLIFGAIAGLLMLRRWRFPIRPFLDAVAPAMMLGYAIGRIGCQVAGDGDWGHAADMALKPEWLPTWFWAQTYENNIVGAIIPGPGVYPTPIYESLMSTMCFIVLWALRNHQFRTGWLFSLYLLLAGVERLLIEQIRLNPVLEFGWLRATQAELIAALMVLAGILGVTLLSGSNISCRVRVSSADCRT